MSGKKEAPVFDGLALSSDEDEGIHVRYPGLPDDQTVVLRTVLEDGMLDAATEAANKSGKTSNAKFRATLIKQMVLKSNVKHRGVDPSTGNPYLDLKDDATLATLPAPFLNWLANEINRCDGSIAGVSKVVIAGKEVDFRAPA